jgi:hypothetical protein
MPLFLVQTVSCVLAKMDPWLLAGSSPATMTSACAATSDSGDAGGASASVTSTGVVALLACNDPSLCGRELLTGPAAGTARCDELGPGAEVVRRSMLRR